MEKKTNFFVFTMLWALFFCCAAYGQDRNVSGTVTDADTHAPMAGVTDTAFRQICAEMGAGLTCTELISSKALCYHDKKTFTLLRQFPEYYHMPSAEYVSAAHAACNPQDAKLLVAFDRRQMPVWLSNLLLNIPIFWMAWKEKHLSQETEVQERSKTSDRRVGQ